MSQTTGEKLKRLGFSKLGIPKKPVAERKRYLQIAPFMKATLAIDALGYSWGISELVDLSKYGFTRIEVRIEL